MNRRLVALIGAALLAPAGCAPGQAAAPVAAATVDLPPSYRFAPAAVSVETGATVTWRNSDRFTHSVQFVDGELSTSPLLMEPGASATFTFERAGSFEYVCHLHPQNMKGSVTVTP